MKTAWFKAYAIRGHFQDDLNENLAYRIGRAYAAEINLKPFVVGLDTPGRPALAGALAKSFTVE